MKPIYERKIETLLNHYHTLKKNFKGMKVLIGSALIAGESVNQIQSGMLSTTLQISIQSIIAAQQVAWNLKSKFLRSFFETPIIAAVSASSTATASSAS